MSAIKFDEDLTILDDNDLAQLQQLPRGFRLINGYLYSSNILNVNTILAHIIKYLIGADISNYDSFGRTKSNQGYKVMKGTKRTMLLNNQYLYFDKVETDFEMGEYVDKVDEIAKWQVLFFGLKSDNGNKVISDKEYKFRIGLRTIFDKRANDDKKD